MDALTRLAGDPQKFIDTLWARRVHLHRTDPDGLVGLLGRDDVDHLLTSTALRTPAIRLAQDGQVLSSSRYTRKAAIAGTPMTGLIDPRKVLELFEDGATVILQGLHRYWPALTDLVRALELELGHPCQANAYLTPPGAQGFGRHSDAHDVFVFQTYGAKQWLVHEGDTVHEVRMQPGLSMYMPAGTPHSARTEQAPSLHVTIGINSIKWREVLIRTAQTWFAAPEFDAPLPAGYHRDGSAADALAAEFETKLDRLRHYIDNADPAALAAGEVERFAKVRPPAVRGGLLDRLDLPNLDDKTWLRRRPGAVCELRSGGDRLRVLLGDRELRVPSYLAEPLQTIRSANRLRAVDLGQWLDPESRLVLVRRLVREGLLEVER